jgi:hypothetical protein
MVKYKHREAQPQILQNKKFSAFFDHCIGAIDGNHIPAIAPENEQQAFHNQKGTVMQNLLGVVNFDLTFQYALTGWEGSTHYGKVFQDALTKGLNIPVGKYYLGDAYEIVKKRFPILKAMNCQGYTFSVQAKLVVACFGIHNFIRVNQGYEDEYDIPDEEEEDEFFAASSVDVDDADESAYSSYRDDIACILNVAAI